MDIEEIINHQELVKEKLLKSPKGFKLDDDYICVICQKIIRNNKGWYDKYGPKCLYCQKATDDGVIPKKICTKRDSWLAMWEVSQRGYHPMVIKKLIRKKQLKAKIIKDNNGKPYFYVFLLKDNKLLDTQFSADH